MPAGMMVDSNSEIDSRLSDMFVIVTSTPEYEVAVEKAPETATPLSKLIWLALISTIDSTLPPRPPRLMTL
ncbi:hypothetical protein [Devosia sp.]|uniref:hypothetical protein n=1 Tax=Devosia sp. TaxID=1871048 RepID=UPI001ACE1EDE|nr:hypothetical protein [Devosia sp.]MBN9308500.1 hypothetical protein [Devosia sp.]